MRFFNILILFVLGMSAQINAQKIKLKDGDFTALKGQKEVNVIYDYSDMSVGKYKVESEYLDDRQAKRNEKEAGTGDKWRKSWVDDREARFHPMFEELMNKHLEKPGIEIGSFPDAEYTLLVHTIHTEPGFNVGVMRKPAFINLVIKLKKTGSDEVLGKVAVNKAPGRDAMGYDFDTGYRISEAYAKAGKSFAKYLYKKHIK